MKVKNMHLVLVSVVGLFTLAIYSTYAMFSATVETEDFVNLTASNIELDSQIVEYERITINAKDMKTIDFNINNNTNSNLYYGTWYGMVIPNVINDDIIIAKYVNSEDDTFGLINSNSSKKVTLVVSNNTNSNITINIGVAYSKTSSLNLPINRELITGEYEPKVDPNPPKLVDNMIPVMYYNNNWVKADTDNPNGTYK